MIHNIIIIIAIITIICLQIHFFLKNRQKQKELESIFPDNCDKKITIANKNGIAIIVNSSDSWSLAKKNEIDEKLRALELKYQEYKNELDELITNNIPASRDNKITDLEFKLFDIEEKIKELTTNQGDLTFSTNTIKSQKTSIVFKNIISAINNYLIENKGAASDFHLIKDVVDRNCDSVEEEIATLTPIPLYLGLIGTMTGILIGVGFLVFSGGIDALLNAQQENAGTGIIELLGGIALAMISSIAGIFLTTTGSYFTKESKSKLNRNKNGFLSWIQARLLPTLSANTSTAIYTLQQNLSNFNNTFASNIQNMTTTFSTLRESQRDQLKLMQIVEKMDVSQMAKANITVLKELQNSTQEFETFNSYLHNVTGYLEKVDKLSTEVNDHLNRTKVIEDMGAFFKDEAQQIQERKGAISKTVGEVDVTLQKALLKFQENTEQQLDELIKRSVLQHNKFDNAIEEQQKSLEQRLEETSILVEELKNLTAIKTTITSLEKATLEQNKKMESLTTAIKTLAQAKTESKSSPNLVIPNWLRISGISASLILGTAGLLYIISQLAHYVNLF